MAQTAREVGHWLADPRTSAVGSDVAAAFAALAEAHRGGGVRQLARAAERHFWPLLRTRPAELDDLLRALPSDVLERHPLLVHVHPMASSMAGSPAASAADPAGDVDDAGRLRALVSRMVALRRSGDVATAAGVADRLVELLTDLRVPSLSDATGPLPFYFAQVAVTRLLAGDVLAAIRAATTARQMADADASSPVRRFAFALLALAHALRGGLAEARAALDAAAGSPPGSRWFASWCAALESVARAIVAVDALDPAAGAVVAAAYDERLPSEIVAVAALAGSRHAVVRGVPAEALDVLDRLVPPRMASSGLAADIRSAGAIEAHVAMGDLAAARSVVVAGSPGPMTSLALLRLRIHTGDGVGALAAASRLSRSTALSPAQREELQLARAYISVQLTGGVDAAEANGIARLAAATTRRRQLSSNLSPCVIEAVAVHLDSDRRAALLRCLDPVPDVSDIPAAPRLSPGEVRVLAVLVHRASTTEIADALFVSPNTVKTQLRSLYRKLGVHSRTQAIGAAVRWGLVDPAEISERVSA
ncbi:hypothetical protein GCM10022200_17190 [Microbacterium awajiense]|uniref:HTH luxR-type domain-containing protein n=1 Tax=Microbacterium awajiense TaxID=415214 RepID=A0ABP7AK34_9MICO